MSPLVAIRDERERASSGRRQGTPLGFSFTPGPGDSGGSWRGQRGTVRYRSGPAVLLQGWCPWCSGALWKAEQRLFCGQQSTEQLALQPLVFPTWVLTHPHLISLRAYFPYRIFAPRDGRAVHVPMKTVSVLEFSLGQVFAHETLFQLSSVFFLLPDHVLVCAQHSKTEVFRKEIMDEKMWLAEWRHPDSSLAADACVAYFGQPYHTAISHELTLFTDGPNKPCFLPPVLLVSGIPTQYFIYI